MESKGRRGENAAGNINTNKFQRHGDAEPCCGFPGMDGWVYKKMGGGIWCEERGLFHREV